MVFLVFFFYSWCPIAKGGGGCRDHMVVGFTTTYEISTYHHYSCEFESSSWGCLLATTLYDKVCRWHAADLWFSLGTPVSFTNKTDCHDTTEILLKVALNIISLAFILLQGKWNISCVSVGVPQGKSFFGRWTIPLNKYNTYCPL